MSHYPGDFLSQPVAYYDLAKSMTASFSLLQEHEIEIGAERIASQRPSADDTNPKDRAGAAKVDLSLFPPAGLIHGAHALVDGSAKYGPFNWRAKKVRARVYIAAVQRHLASYLDGEDVAEDSGVHHLGHAMACCAIILDALETGNLVDDRPAKGAAAELLARLNATIAASKA